MSAPSPKSLALATAIVLTAGVAYADSSTAVAAPTLSTRGGRLAIVDVDTVSDNIYVITTSSLTNKARVRQRGTTLAGLVLTQIGQSNSADVSVSGRNTLTSVEQSSGTVHGGQDKMQLFTVNGDYVCVYQSGGFGYIGVTSASLTKVGRLGR